MRVARSALLSLVIAAVASSGTDARAEPGDAGSVAVLPTRIEGEVEGHWRETLEEHVIDGLGRGRFEHVGPEEVRARSTDAQTCNAPACWTRIASDVGAAHLLVTAVQKRGRDWTFAVKLVDGATGEVLATKDDRCEICGVGEVAQRLADDVAGIVPKLDDLSQGASLLVVTSTPAGAEVTIDGDPAGVTPLEREVIPGQHVVELRLAGHVVEKRRLVAAKGTRERLELELEPLPETRAYTIAGWTGIGAGVALVGAGVTLLVLDERPYKRDCSGNNVDVNGTCRKRYDTLVGGAVLTGVGVALVATGVGLLVAGRKSRRRADRGGKIAHIVPALDGVSLRF